MADEPMTSPEPADDPQRRRRFEAVLGADFGALGAGQCPDRQELLSKHPDLADELEVPVSFEFWVYARVLRRETSGPILDASFPLDPFAG
jgi:hypothetical protein